MDIINRVRAVNFWEGEFTRTGYLREHYLNKVDSYLGNQLIKVFVGQRRTGKSYLLRQVMQRLVLHHNVPPQNIFYFNKENLEFDFVMHYSDLDKLINEYRNEIKPKGKVYLFLDEIQQVAGWEKLVNAYSQSYKQEYELCITGSNSDMLSTELASHLTGRYIQVQIFPFFYEEFVNYKGLERSKRTYLEYMSSSGLPELFNLPIQETQRHYVSALTDTIILRDIVERYGVREIALLKDLFAFAANNVSNLFSINNVANYLKNRYGTAKYETVANFTAYLVNAHLMHECPRYNLKGKAVMSGTRKYYLNDLGYKNLLYSGFEHGYGYMLENLVYLQLKRNGYEVYTGTFQGREIDFIALKNDQPLYVQVAYNMEDSETRDREYGSLLPVKDNYPKVVVTLDDLQMPDYEGIKHILAWESEDYF